MDWNNIKNLNSYLDSSTINKSGIYYHTDLEEFHSWFVSGNGTKYLLKAMTERFINKDEAPEFLWNLMLQNIEDFKAKYYKMRTLK